MTQVLNSRSGVRRLTFRSGAVAVALLAATACTTTSTSTTEADGSIDYRKDRFETISARQDFMDCRDQALKLDRRARETGNAGRFLASARLLERCERELGKDADSVGTKGRMRAYALSIQNYVKGGDAASAAENLDTFRQQFPNRDLYLANGASFKDTMGALLGQTPETSLGSLSTLNTASAVKDELRRVRHWQRN